MTGLPNFELMATEQVERSRRLAKENVQRCQTHKALTAIRTTPQQSNLTIARRTGLKLAVVDAARETYNREQPSSLLDLAS